jgi:hypothetical protein
MNPVDNPVERWGNRAHRVGSRALSPRTVSERCGKLWAALPMRKVGATRPDAPFSTIHRPYYYSLNFSIPLRRAQ